MLTTQAEIAAGGSLLARVPHPQVPPLPEAGHKMKRILQTSTVHGLLSVNQEVDPG
ncbi:hypothetical protein LHP98_14475 [Rhodobacter sp. Har01]|uniref:hypothetical protein n=1 Tax=Rhodobacter sp. Har01 TaxID=2883999 RepID=UPI001D096A5E|nr:hypothetical protein [Rhodobacter sp. Har01]MCB6179327.1 hypothetical protein [Rhodobacter sp. Har01]